MPPGNSAPKSRDVPGEGVQLTRGAGAGVAVAPVRGLVTLATLWGAQLGPLLAAQAAVAPRQRGGLGDPQGSAHGLAGSPRGCCRDRTETLLREREAGVDVGLGPKGAATSQLQPGALRSRVTPSSCALLPKNTSDSSAVKPGVRSWPGMCCQEQLPAAKADPGMLQGHGMTTSCLIQGKIPVGKAQTLTWHSHSQEGRQAAEPRAKH